MCIRDRVISRHLFADDLNEESPEKMKNERPPTPPSQRVLEVKKRPEMKKSNSNEEIMFDQSEFFFIHFIFNSD